MWTNHFLLHITHCCINISTQDLLVSLTVSKCISNFTLWEPRQVLEKKRGAEEMGGAVNGERLSGHQTLQVHGHDISSLQQLTYQYAEFKRNPVCS